MAAKSPCDVTRAWAEVINNPPSPPDGFGECSGIHEWATIDTNEYFLCGKHRDLVVNFSKALWEGPGPSG